MSTDNLLQPLPIVIGEYTEYSTIPIDFTSNLDLKDLNNTLSVIKEINKYTHTVGNDIKKLLTDYHQSTKSQIPVYIPSHTDIKTKNKDCNCDEIIPEVVDSSC